MLSVGVLSFADSPFLPSPPSFALTGFARATAGCLGALVKDDSFESASPPLVPLLHQKV